jgi:hypothetical protein
MISTEEANVGVAGAINQPFQVGLVRATDSSLVEVHQEGFRIEHPKSQTCEANQQRSSKEPHKFRINRIRPVILFGMLDIPWGA